jgi:hypothetical protein
MLLKNESQATTSYLNSRRNEVWKNGWAYKIPDVGRALKPFDVIGVMRDRLGNIQMFVREFKYIKTKKINYETAYAHLEPHQITNLYKLSEMGVDAKVIAYHQETQKYYLYPFKVLNGQQTEAWTEETESTQTQSTDATASGTQGESWNGIQPSELQDPFTF